MKRILLYLVGGFFYMCLLLLWGRQYTLLKVQAKEIKILSDGYTSFFIEDKESPDNVLSDNIGYIGEVNELENTEDYQEDYQDYSNGSDVSSDISEDEETMNADNQFRIMVIFCFGLCAGIVVGHFLTGFIK